MTNLPKFSMDFDGVLHNYSQGWKGADVITDPPTPGAIAALEEYVQHFEVNVFSSRSHQAGGREAMKDWCIQHFGLPLCRHLIFPLEKPPALIGLDDRIITFTGTWPDLATLKAFRPWNKK